MLYVRAKFRLPPDARGPLAGVEQPTAVSSAAAGRGWLRSADPPPRQLNIVFLGDSLAVVPMTVRAARRTRAIVRQNFALAIGYNVIAVPLALAFARYDFRGKRWIEVAILMSMLSPPFVGAYAWILMFGRSGMVRQALASIGIDIPPIYGTFGIALATAFSHYPVMFLVVRSGHRREVYR
jgi:ABC-type Fe3+ transport system permease subunit